MTGIYLQRKKAGYTQQNLAQKVGVTQSAVAKWDTGESLPRAAMLPNLALLFGCSIDDLLSSTEKVG